MKRLSIAIAFVSSFLVSLSVAVAQVGAPPPPPPPPLAGGASGTGGFSLGARAMVAMPSGNVDNVVDTSLGMRLLASYDFHPFVDGIASFDYIVGNEEDGVPGDYSFYSVGFGARFHPSGDRPIRPFGEFLLGLHAVSFDVAGSDDSESDLGFRLGGGAQFAMGGSLLGELQLTWSAAEIEGVDIEALILEGGFAWRF